MTLREVINLYEGSNPPFLDLVRRERPYQIPKGYMRWQMLSVLIALCLEGESAHGDLATHLHMSRSKLWFLQNAPIYCMSTKLIQAFDETDILERQALLADLYPPLPTFLLLFPQGLIKAPGGGSLDHVIVHLADRIHPEHSRASGYGLSVPYLKHEHERNLHWSGVDSNETVWLSGMGLESDGTVLQSQAQLGAHDLSTEDQPFLDRMKSITLQVLLTLTYRPDLLEAEPATSSVAPQKRHRRQSKSQQVLHPRWLGKNYGKHSSSKTGTHNTPRGHWRKGHWRRVVVGEGRTGRRWHWFEPTFVGD